MKSLLVVAMGVLAALGGLSEGAMHSVLADTDVPKTVAIRIAPSTLILDASQGGYITVHAAIPYHMVDTATVALEGLPATSTFADDRGNLVAKFNETSIKSMLKPGTLTLTLTGRTWDNTPFTGVNMAQATLWRKPSR